MPIPQSDIDNRFTYHPPKGNATEVYTAIRSSAKELAEDINAMVPDGREKSLAITKLEEAVMWANAGFARGPEQSDG